MLACKYYTWAYLHKRTSLYPTEIDKEICVVGPLSADLLVSQVPNKRLSCKANFITHGWIFRKLLYLRSFLWDLGPSLQIGHSKSCNIHTQDGHEKFVKSV